MNGRDVILILMFLLVGTSIVDAQEIVNLFDSPGFEEGTETGVQNIPGWQLYKQENATGLLSINTEEAIEGNQCVFIEVTGVPAGGTWNLRFDHTRRFRVEQGETYTMSIWLKGDPGPVTLSPSRAEQNAAGQWGNLAQQVVEPTPEWEEYHLTFESPEDRLVMWQLLISNPGQTYYVDHARCYVGEYVPDVIGPQLQAYSPYPLNEATDVSQDAELSWTQGEYANTHTVYLSMSREDVNDDSTAALVAEVLDVNTYSTGRLDFDQTYYWRVDEVNGAPDFAVLPGGVWSFTVEPFSIPIANVTTTASSSFAISLPENVVNGSGLSGDLHGTSAEDMWISGAIPATIEFAFDRVYKLHELWIWNSNQLIESFVGFGAKDVVIEHSRDGENWTVLDGVGPLAQAPGTGGYAHNNTVDFGGIAAQQVRITVNSVQGIAPQASLSEVRFYTIPTLATRPDPADGATGVAPDVALGWGRGGRDAGQHEVYVGTDADSMTLAESVTGGSFESSSMDLDLSQSYIWRVDEVNEAMDPMTWTGTAWSFTTIDSIGVDDMETYKDEEFFEIWATWIDGFDDSANNGALVGASPNLGDFAPESDIVNSGNNSLPIWYDNGAAPVSEATRTFDQAQDWTQFGVQTLVLYFSRGVGNTGNGSLYVKINDTKVIHPGDDSALPPAWDLWTQWNIDLTALGADLSAVRSLTIGIEGAGAQGVFYVDDIELYRNAPAASSEQVVAWFEAESGALTLPMKQFIGDPQASGTAFIGTDDLIGDQNAAPPADGVATFSFDVPEDGVYRLAFRVLISGGNDSFWVRVSGMTTNTGNDASGWVRFNEIQPGDTWHWDEVHSNDDGNQVVDFTLSAGNHTLEIAQREDGTILDAIAVIK